MNKYRIQLDICSVCNLNCPACGMRKINYGDIGKGYTTFEHFKNFIDNNLNYIESIEISNSGEPFLNPDSIQILKYANSLNIPLTCKNGTNFNFQNDDLIKAMVDYKLRTVYIAIDGVTEQSYIKYRRNGNFNLVMSNLNKLVEYKKQQNSKYPEIVWQYIIRESTDNLEEIQNAKELANKLGIKLDFKLTWEKDYKPLNENQLKEITGLNEILRENVSISDCYSKFHKCKVTYFDEKIVINWNGNWLICCNNKIPTNVNIFKIGLEGLFKSKEYLDIKAYLFEGEPKNNLCSKCRMSVEIDQINSFLKYTKEHYKSDSWKDLL